MWRFVLLVIASALAFGAGVKVDEWRHGAAETKTVTRIVYVTAKQGDVNTQAAAKDAQVQTQIKYVTRTIIKEVPRVLPPETDARFPLSNGFVRLHDAAAQGRELPDVSQSPGGTDGQASAVAESAAAKTIVANYGECLADQQRLSAAQDWINAQAKAFDATK